MKMRSFAAILIIFVILLTNYTTIYAQTQPEFFSEAVYLANSTGQVLFSSNENKKYQPGGIVKMVTCLIALENNNIADTVEITKEAVTSGETNAALKEGEIMSVEDLTYCAIVANASDAAKALAIQTAGSEEAFVNMMNQKAKELGCENTNFTNCTGTNDENQYTTPADLFLLTMAAINNASLNPVLRTSRKTIKKTNKSDERFYYSNNYLICAYYDNRYFYSDAQGGKSGYTPDGGYALTAFATVGNTQLIAIAMGGNDEKGISTFKDALELFNYGFDNYKSVSVTTSGDILYETKVKYASPSDNIILCAQHSLKALVDKNDEDYEFEAKFNIPDNIEPPIKKGTVLGSVTYSYKGNIVGTVPLTASESLSATSVFYIIKGIKFLWGFTIVKVIAFILLLAVLFIVFIFFSVLTGAVRLKKRPKVKRRPKYTRKKPTSHNNENQ